MTTFNFNDLTNNAIDLVVAIMGEHPQAFIDYYQKRYDALSKALGIGVIRNRVWTSPEGVEKKFIEFGIKNADGYSVTKFGLNGYASRLAYNYHSPFPLVLAGKINTIPSDANKRLKELNASISQNETLTFNAWKELNQHLRELLSSELKDLLVVARKDAAWDFIDGVITVDEKDLAKAGFDPTVERAPDWMDFW